MSTIRDSARALGYRLLLAAVRRINPDLHLVQLVREQPEPHQPEAQPLCDLAIAAQLSPMLYMGLRPRGVDAYPDGFN